MNKIYTTFLLAFSLLIPSLLNAKEQTITLRDGSVIKGELTGMADGVYTVKTGSLGSAEIKAEEIASINNDSHALAAPAVPTSQDATNGQINQLQQGIMANPAMMADIQQIAADPEIVKLISNPAIMQAVMAHDVNAIRNDPAARELMNNPKMMALIEKLRSNSNTTASE